MSEPMIARHALQWRDGPKSELRVFTAQDVQYGYDTRGAWALLEDMTEVRAGDWVIREDDGSLTVRKDLTTKENET